jgi:hypothetical protein
MPTFLVDPPESLYLFLGLLVVVTGAVWFSRRTRWTLVAFLIALAVVAIVFLIDFLRESPRESAVTGVKEISEAINARNWDAFDARVSKDFEYKGLKKADLRKKMAEVITAFDARTAVWEFNRDKVEQKGDNQIAVVFDAKGDPKSGAAYYAHFKATFIRESDGIWRLKTFAVYPYASKTNGPEEELPGIK